MRSVPHAADRDRGDTLVEILVAIAVLGVGIVGMITALATNIHVTTLDKSQSKANAVLSAAAEYVAAHGWYSCGNTGSTLTTAQVPHDNNFTITVGAPSNLVAAGSPTCAGNGIERLTVTVTGAASTDFSASQDVVLLCNRTVQSDGSCS